MQIALCQTVYNLMGIAIFYPIRQMRRIPVELATKFGKTTEKHRWFALVYIVFVFFLMPAALLALSLFSLTVMLAILCPVVVLLIFLIGINILQANCAQTLPNFLQNWNFLPLHLRSLAPYDIALSRCCFFMPFCGHFFVENRENCSHELNSDSATTTTSTKVSKQSGRPDYVRPINVHNTSTAFGQSTAV